MVITNTTKARKVFSNWKRRNYKYFLRRFNAQGGICPICHELMVIGKTLSPKQRQRQQQHLATIDHTIPIAEGGDAIDMRNMRVICFGCNQGKEANG